MTALDKFISEINQLKPIPAVTHQLLSVVDNPDVSMADIADMIQYDPVITAGVINTCNSAYYSRQNPVESIKDAVNMLGTEKIIEIALTKSGADALSGRQKGYGLEKGEMWKYAVASAILAKDIASRFSLKNKNMIFTSALLKDVGKIVLEKYVYNSADQITTLVQQEGLSFREAEKKVFGIDHAELGAMIAKMWNFSPKMIKIIHYHHLSDEKMMRDKEVCAVYLADCIGMMLGIGVGSDGLAYRFREDVMKLLNISAHDVSLIIADFGSNMQEIEQLLQL